MPRSDVRFNQTNFKPTDSRGFTLVELVVTLGVAAILMGMAAPSVSQFLQNNRLKSDTYQLLGSIAVARSEAVKRGSQVVICRSADTTTCDGTVNNWKTGWLVYVDTNSNWQYDPPGETVLRRETGTTGDADIITNGSGGPNLSYANTGESTYEILPGGTVLFSICDKRGEAYGRQISVLRSGRASITHGSPATPIGDCTP